MTDLPPLLDTAVVSELLESVAGDQDFVRELVAAYLAETPDYVAALAAAAATGDPAALVRPAHTIKSSSAAVGAMRLSAVSRQVEHAAREGSVDGAGVEAIQALWPETIGALRTAGLID